MKRILIYRNETLYTIKEGLTKADLISSGYFDKHPDAVVCDRKPSLALLERWSDDGVAEAIDGCRVEPDGICEHGRPSWFLALGLI